MLVFRRLENNEFEFDEIENSERSLVWMVIWCLPLLYFLSVGPAMAIVDATKPVGAAFLDLFYAPLVWLHQHTFLEFPIEWYVGLWT